MAIQEQYILVKKTNGDVGITQNSVEVFSSINSGAIVNTLVLKEGNVGIGTATPSARLNIQNDGTGHGLYINQTGVLANSSMGLRIYSNAVQINNSYLLYLQQANASSTSNVSYIVNAGTGTGLFISQDGVLANNKVGLYIYSNVIQVNNSQLLCVFQANASSGSNAVVLHNSGTGTGLYLLQDGVQAGGQYALYVTSAANQTNSELVRFHQDHASSAGGALTLVCDSAASCLYIKQVGNATTGAIELDNDGTGHGLYIHQDGVLAANKCGLYVYSNTAQVNAPLVRFCQDSATSTYDVLRIDNDGTGHSIYIVHNGAISDSVAGIRIDGCDVANGTNTVTISNVAPAGVGTATIAKWLLVDISGTRYYIPMWT